MVEHTEPATLLDLRAEIDAVVSRLRDLDAAGPGR